MIKRRTNKITGFHTRSLAVCAIVVGILASACSFAPNSATAPRANHIGNQRVVAVWDADIEFTAPDGGAYDNFGSGTSMSGDSNSFVVGVCSRTVDGKEYQGKVYIYQMSGVTWSDFSIVASEGAAGDLFGFSVSMSFDGRTVAVGAPGYLSYQGKVYVYRWTGASWSETIITASDGAAFDEFGDVVSISYDGNILAVGATSKTVDGNDYQGKVYVYQWNGAEWAETGIVASDGAAGDQFGYSISMSGAGNAVVIGSYGNNNSQGKAYHYKWNGAVWEETILTDSTGTAGDYFGFSVGLSGDGNMIAVGAIGKDSSAGRAFIYQWNGSSWTETAVVPSDGAAGDQFGYCISMSGNAEVFAVSAYSSDNPMGKVYIFSWNGASWVESKLTVPESEIGDMYGSSIGLSDDGNSILIGAMNRTVNGNPYQGKAYVFFGR